MEKGSWKELMLREKSQRFRIQAGIFKWVDMELCTSRIPGVALGK
jgi:hypothetical protein